MNVLAFDFETTGLTVHPSAPLDRQPRPIEFGGVLVDHLGRELDTIEVLIDPGVDIEPKITEITGITNEMLREQGVPFDEAAAQILPLFRDADVMVAHNLPFDETILRLALKRAGIADWPWPRGICTAQEYRAVNGKRPRLIHLHEQVMGRKLEQTHRALDDVRALVAILLKEQTIERLHAATTPRPD